MHARVDGGLGLFGLGPRCRGAKEGGVLLDFRGDEGSDGPDMRRLSMVLVNVHVVGALLPISESHVIILQYREAIKSAVGQKVRRRNS